MRLALVLLIAALGPGLPGSEALADRLRPLLAEVPAGARAGIAVIDVDRGEWIVRAGSDRPLRMASLTKLLVAAAALYELGPDHAFATRVYALGPVVDGSVPGLGVVGDGSPCLDEHFTDRQPDRIFAAWAAQLRAAGITRIDGDLVIDGRLFQGPIRPPTYPSDHRNAQRWYSAPASAFAFNDNCIDVRVVPTDPGRPARVETRPRSPRIEIVNRTRTVSADPSDGIVVSRAHHANRLIVSGRYRETTAWFPLAIHADPDLLAGDHLAAQLADAGLRIAGDVRRAPVPADPERLLIEHRDPLLPALSILNGRSQNFYGEQILRVLGHRIRGRGSIADGAAAVLAILERELELPGAPVNLLDGSGLSYDNRASAAWLCRLLRRTANGDHGDRFVSTLKDRWAGHVRARVKTGSLGVARCLAGYVPGPDGTSYAFAILCNRAEARSIGWANSLRSKAFRAICEILGEP